MGCLYCYFNHVCSSLHACSFQSVSKPGSGSLFMRWWIQSVTEMQEFWYAASCLFRSWFSDWWDLWSWHRSTPTLLSLPSVWGSQQCWGICYAFGVSGGRGGVSFLARLEDFLVVGLLLPCRKMERYVLAALDSQICAEFQDIVELKHHSVPDLHPYRLYF